jgi:hypothetical protein
MTSPQETPEEARQRYTAAAHGMQTGVATKMHWNPNETLPKHLRVGVNAAMVDTSAIAGLLIARELIKDELARHVIVGVVELHMVKKAPGEAPIPTVRFVAIEPLHGDAEDQGRQMLNQARNARGLSIVPEGLFDMPADVDGPEAAADDGPGTERQRDEWLDPDAR